VYAVCAAAEVERSGAQHLHADFALNAATVALVAARLTGRTFSFAAHANDIFVNPVLLREKVSQAAFATPISEFNRRYLLNAGADATAADRLHVIHCGLEFSQFSPNGQTPSKGRPLILGVGRLVEKKGFHVLIEACRLLKEQDVSVECQIVGGGPQEVRLRELIKQHGVTDCVQLVGPQPQERVRALMQHAAMFVLPCVVAHDNDQDGIPVVLMEAMAFERPVISTPLSGIPELVQDNVNGLLVTSGSAPELAGAIRRVLEDGALARRLGEVGRQTVAAEFNVERSAQQLAKLFQKVTTDSRK
jgi:colanic acid/amylovoran biosynthesis glycosyltransferase